MKITVTRRPASPDERRNPTDFFTWDAAVDGKTVVTGQPGARVAYLAAIRGRG